MRLQRKLQTNETSKAEQQGPLINSKKLSINPGRLKKKQKKHKNLRTSIGEYHDFTGPLFIPSLLAGVQLNFLKTFAVYVTLDIDILLRICYFVFWNEKPTTHFDKNI